VSSFLKYSTKRSNVIGNLWDAEIRNRLDMGDIDKTGWRRTACVSEGGGSRKVSKKGEIEEGIKIK